MVDSVLNSISSPTTSQFIRSNQGLFNAINQSPQKSIILKLFFNWATYQIIKSKNAFPNNDLNSHIAAVLNVSIGREIKDFIAGIALDNTFDLIKSKLNNTEYKISDLSKDAADWHERLKEKKAKTPQNQGRVVVELSDGFKWVSLDKNYCSEEAKAMGHCGNSAGSPKDVIYSLRDSENKPYLTFVVNNGALVERRGKYNEKPGEEYHQDIVQFLLATDNGHPIVEYIPESRYEPEGDFQFSDLSKEEQEQILKVKPGINNMGAYFTNMCKKDPAKAKESFEDIFQTKTIGVDSSTIFIEEVAEDSDSFINFLNERLSSKSKYIFSTSDDFFNNHHNLDFDDLLENFDRYADTQSVSLMADYLERHFKVEENELRDVNPRTMKDNVVEFIRDNEDEVRDNSDIEELLSSVCSDLEAQGSEADMWESINKNIIDSPDDDSGGLFVTYNKQNNKYCLAIYADDVGGLYKLYREEQSPSLETLYTIKNYSFPHYGFSLHNLGSKQTGNLYNQLFLDRFSGA